MDIDSLNHFITFYNLSTLIPAAIEKRDSIAYKEAQSQKTASAMKGFLTQYPQSKLFNEARTKYDKLFYNEETPGWFH